MMKRTMCLPLRYATVATLHDMNHLYSLYRVAKESDEMNQIVFRNIVTNACRIARSAWPELQLHGFFLATSQANLVECLLIVMTPTIAPYSQPTPYLIPNF